MTGTAMLDGLPEALELPGADFVLGVQWHPEADERSRVIGGARRGGERRTARLRCAERTQPGSATTASSSTSASRGSPATATATRAGGSVSKNDW